MRLIPFDGIVCGVKIVITIIEFILKMSHMPQMLQMICIICDRTRNRRHNLTLLVSTQNSLCCIGWVKAYVTKAIYYQWYSAYPQQIISITNTSGNVVPVSALIRWNIKTKDPPATRQPEVSAIKNDAIGGADRQKRIFSVWLAIPPTVKNGQAIHIQGL